MRTVTSGSPVRLVRCEASMYERLGSLVSHRATSCERLPVRPAAAKEELERHNAMPAHASAAFLANCLMDAFSRATVRPLERKVGAEATGGSEVGSRCEQAPAVSVCWSVQARLVGQRDEADLHQHLAIEQSGARQPLPELQLLV